MSEKRFSVRLRSECDGVVYSFFDGDKLIDVDMIVDLLNYQDRLIEEQHDEIINWTKKYVGIKKENEKLRKQIQIYEQLISNSYVGEEETLDGFVGKYVIWENELQKYKEKIKGVFNE